MKRLRTFWFTSKKTVGIVVGEDTITRERKAYIGVVRGFNEKADEREIAEWGSPVNVRYLEEIVTLLKGSGDGTGSKKKG